MENPETVSAAVKEWKNCGVEKKNFLKILWKSGAALFNTVETVKKQDQEKVEWKQAQLSQTRKLQENDFHRVFHLMLKTRWKPVYLSLYFTFSTVLFNTSVENFSSKLLTSKPAAGSCHGYP